MIQGNVCECLNENRIAIQAFCPLDSWVIGFVDDFSIQLVKGFDMVAGKGDGDQNQICLPAFDILLNGMAGLGSQPCRRSDLGLPAQSVGIGES